MSLYGEFMFMRDDII